MSPKNKLSFQKSWLLPSESVDYDKWVEQVPNDKYSAICKICSKVINGGGQGISALATHARGENHKLRMPSESQSIASYTAVRNPSDKVEQTRGEINSLFKKQDVTAADIVWAVEVVMSNYSFNSCANKGSVSPLILKLL